MIGNPCQKFDPRDLDYRCGECAGCETDRLVDTLAEALYGGLDAYGSASDASTYQALAAYDAARGRGPERARYLLTQDPPTVPAAGDPDAMPVWTGIRFRALLPDVDRFLAEDYPALGPPLMRLLGATMIQGIEVFRFDGAAVTPSGVAVVEQGGPQVSAAALVESLPPVGHDG